MRDLTVVVNKFSKINDINDFSYDCTGGGVEILLRRGIVTARFFVPENGSQAVIQNIYAYSDDLAGAGAGKGVGRQLIDDVISVLDSEGINSLGVVGGSEYWNIQSDFRRIEGGTKITHTKEW